MIKRYYWNISDKTQQKIYNIYKDNIEYLTNPRIVYGEIIEIAIDNLLLDLKDNNLNDIKKLIK